jgi:iron complex outermembrane receptor protein
MLIFSGIVAGLPRAIGQSFESARQGDINIFALIAIGLLLCWQHVRESAPADTSQRLDLPGLALLGGARYSASKYASQAGNVAVGGYTVFDVGSRYRTRIGGYDTVLRLTVDNLFDKRYWRDVGDYLGDNYLFQGAPRTARLSASVSF